MMLGKKLVFRFGIGVRVIAYFVEGPNGACSVHLKNGTVIDIQESFQAVTEAYEKILGSDLDSRIDLVETHGREPKEVEY